MHRLPVIRDSVSRPSPARRVLPVLAYLTFSCAQVELYEGIEEPGARPVLLARGAGEGPAWHPELGILFSGDEGILRVSRTGERIVVRERSGTNGLLFDRDGQLLACEPGQRRMTRTNLETGEVAVLTDRYEGKRYNSPNDLTIDSGGRIYFSDPRYGPREGMEMLDAEGRPIEGVYRIDPGGTVTRIITHEVDRPNGVLVSSGDDYLFVADNNNDTVGGARKLWRFRLRADGTVDLTTRKLLFDWGSSRGPDGMVQDIHGTLFVAGGLNEPNPPFETTDRKGGVYVLDPEDGVLRAFIPIPRDEVTNCTFGSDDLETLYITAGGTLWILRTRSPGWLPWPQSKP